MTAGHPIMNRSVSVFRPITGAETITNLQTEGLRENQMLSVCAQLRRELSSELLRL